MPRRPQLRGPWPLLLVLWAFLTLVAASVPESFILTNATAPSILKGVASARGQVILTTTSGVQNATIDMLDNFCYHLDRVKALRHAMIITTDERYVMERIGWGRARFILVRLLQVDCLLPS